jgi:hypothetical protein
VVALTGGDEKHLIGIADDLVVADIPHEQTAIRQTDLKVGGEALLRLPRTRTAEVFHQADAGLQQPDSTSILRLAHDALDYRQGVILSRTETALFMPRIESKDFDSQPREVLAAWIEIL